jgi:DNA-binding transcriptional regulator YdaS (Cro superfamily)
MLKTHLEQTGERQGDFARRIGISQGFLSQLLNKRRSPSLSVAVRIERATGGAVSVASWHEDAAAQTARPAPQTPTEDAA